MVLEIDWLISQIRARDTILKCGVYSSFNLVGNEIIAEDEEAVHVCGYIWFCPMFNASVTGVIHS